MKQNVSMNGRSFTLSVTVVAASVLTATILTASLMDEARLLTGFAPKLQPPSWAYPFGSDAFGRDMLARTLKGLVLSLQIGLVGATLSVAIALLLALLAASGFRLADTVVSFLVDMTMGLPHLVLLILVSFAFGGGSGGVIIAVAVTHWPRLTRILRAEILQLRRTEYITVSRHFGRSRLFIAYHHMLPHLLPQIMVGFLLLFPHVILHEASMTFLGFGLEPSTPAIGIILSESMNYLTTGKYWLGVVPGLALLATVLSFDCIGNGVRNLMDPRGAQS
ncbi:MAG: ABC transporter permease [Phyllobacterium sp.]